MRKGQTGNNRKHYNKPKKNKMKKTAAKKKWIPAVAAWYKKATNARDRRRLNLYIQGMKNPAFVKLYKKLVAMGKLPKA